jgi:hypothetical protein
MRMALCLCDLLPNINKSSCEKNIRQTQTEGHITKYPTCNLQNVKIINNRKNLRNCNNKEEKQIWCINVIWYLGWNPIA